MSRHITHIVMSRWSERTDWLRKMRRMNGRHVYCGNALRVLIGGILQWGIRMRLDCWREWTLVILALIHEIWRILDRISWIILPRKAALSVCHWIHLESLLEIRSL